MNCQTPLALAFDNAFGIEGAFDERNVREIEGKALGPEHVLNHRQIFRAALHALLDEIVEAALEELDVGQDALVERDRDVVAGLLEIRLDRIFEVGTRGRDRRGRHRQQFVDGCRRVLLLGESIANGEGLHLVGADSVDEPVELVADARLRPTAVWRLEEDGNGGVKFLFRRIDVSEFELPLAGLEMTVGDGDKREDRVCDW